MKIRKDMIFAVLTSFCLSALLFAAIPIRSGLYDYNPWYDLNNDGKINIVDVSMVAKAFGTSGTPFNKTALFLEYDSGWINITDKCAEYFNITHGLNSSDLMVDITGKTAIEGGVHQRNLGGIIQVAGWSTTYRQSDVYGSTANSIVQTYDGGFVVAGITTSDPGWSTIIKFDFAGNQLWLREIGACGISSVIQSSDGGIVVAFLNNYAGGPLSLAKFDSNGNQLWSWEYGTLGEDYERPRCVIQTKDGGYAVAGQKERKWSPYDYDFYLLKTDSNGVQEWNRTYGSLANDIAYSVVQTGDGGYALAGVGFANLVITDQQGNYLRSADYGCSVYSMVETDDGKLAIAGSLVSGSNEPDFFLAKTDLEGAMLWNNTYSWNRNPNFNETAYSLVRTYDGGFALAGIIHYKSSSEYTSFFNWFVKTDSTGEMQWNRTYGGNNFARILSIIQTADGGFAMTGDCNTDSIVWGFDIWVLKTNAEPGLAWIDSTANTITLYRGATDSYWNFVRVRIWKPKTP